MKSLRLVILALEEHPNDQQDMKQQLLDSLSIGDEFFDPEEELYGVFLKEMSGEMPYRIQWYGPEGLGSHIEVNSPEQAAEELITTLGEDLEPAPGSLDQLFLGWSN